jgi:class 3 adenylate cyclase
VTRARPSSLSQKLPAAVRRLAEIGASPADSDELRLRKTVLVLSSALMAALSSVWVVSYAILGLWVPAAIPLAYQLASITSIVIFARTRHYLLFRTSQLWLPLLLPFALQWSLGGFERSSGVSMWAFASPLGALLFVGARQALPWFAGFVALVVFSAAIDPVLADHAPDIPDGVVIAFFALNILGVSTTAYALLQYFVRARDLALAQSERLLLNVLPEPVAKRLKAGHGIIADACPEVTVLFADIVGFTPLSARLSAPELVTVLDRVFADWDALAARIGVEKIKTIGDAYMVAAGVPLHRDDHVEAIADMALAMQPVLARYAAQSGLPLEVRLGIDTGAVVAGVIGRAKFIYDLWGDTVNTASRMESHAPTGGIQVTERVYAHLRDRYELQPRGTIEIKGKGPMSTYLLVARRSRAATTASTATTAARPV